MIDWTKATFEDGFPMQVVHDGLTYDATGKTGTMLASGLPAREYRLLEEGTDARLWRDAAGRVELD